MPWVQNVSLQDIKEGNHRRPGTDTILIQIVDPPGDFPTPKANFKRTFQFDFLDIEDEEDFAFDESQANDIASIIKDAFKNNLNIIVHCVAGVCRSGAVTEVAVQFGFEDTGSKRIPNSRVKRMLSEKLGLSFDPNRSPFNLAEFDFENRY